MANEEHLARLRQGVEAWNAWRETTDAPDLRPDLTGAYLSGTDLKKANLSGTDLTKADLSRARLVEASLSRAHLTLANLTGADLSSANLSGAQLAAAHLVEAELFGAVLAGANLSRANLTRANLNEADLSGADLFGAALFAANLNAAILTDTKLQDTALLETLFINISLAKTRALDRCNHVGPSTIDHRTLQLSGPLPLAFLRGCGLPDKWIEYLPSLLNQPIQHYSCFISYSSKDEDFAKRLYADLQDKGVRSWYAPHDLPIGAKTWDAIDEAIKLRDKLLLILSENSIASDWVEDEVSKAFAEERARKVLVLFPVRIDDVAMTTAEPWAVKLRDQRNIGDFREWKEHNSYQKSLERLLRDLKVPESKPAT
jgi:hypothetical protein